METDGGFSFGWGFGGHKTDLPMRPLPNTFYVDSLVHLENEFGADFRFTLER